jgi:hypothetical protein
MAKRRHRHPQEGEATMRNVKRVTATSLKSNLRQKNLSLLFLGLAIGISVMMIVLIAPSAIGDKVGEGLPWEETKSDLELAFGILLYLTSFMPMGMSILVFTVDPMIKEKAKGSIESLLATPLRPRDVWQAKALAAFLPGFVIGMVFTALTLVSLNYLWVVPEANHFVLTLPIALITFILVPAITFGLSLLTTLIALTSNPNLANIIGIGAMVLIPALLPNLGFRGIIDFSGGFMWINLGIAFVLGIAIVLLRSRLTKEMIVLSSKGS